MHSVFVLTSFDTLWKEYIVKRGRMSPKKTNWIYLINSNVIFAHKLYIITLRDFCFVYNVNLLGFLGFLVEKSSPDGHYCNLKWPHPSDRRHKFSPLNNLSSFDCCNEMWNNTQSPFIFLTVFYLIHKLYNFFKTLKGWNFFTYFTELLVPKRSN